MADISINGTVFDGTPAAPGTPFKPNVYEMPIPKIGKDLTGKDGTETWMHRAHKHVFILTWNKAHQMTLNATRTIWLLTTSFVFVNEFGAPFTVICSGKDTYTEKFAFTNGAGINYYDLGLTLREQ